MRAMHSWKFQFFPLPPQDWAKSNSCEPSLASTLQRRRESVDKMRELEAPPSPLGYSAMQPDDPHRGRIGQGTIASKVPSYQEYT